MILNLVSLNFALFCVQLVSSYEGKEIDSCIKMKNITIVPNIRIQGDDAIQLHEPYLDQLCLLIKSLLRDECTDVWMYSRFEKRSIRMSESNFQHFLETELAMSNFIDENEFLEFTSKLPKATRLVEQTLVYIYFYSYQIHPKPLGLGLQKLKMISGV